MVTPNAKAQTTNTSKLPTFKMNLSRLAQGSGRQGDGNPLEW